MRLARQTSYEPWAPQGAMFSHFYSHGSNYTGNEMTPMETSEESTDAQKGNLPENPTLEIITRIFDVYTSNTCSKHGMLLFIKMWSDHLY